MNCLHDPLSQAARPGSARVLVTELSGTGQINPTPTSRPCVALEVSCESCLTPETLEFFCGSQELSDGTSLEICINTQDVTLGNFGAYLPKLEQLKMNNSIIRSIRDLGSSLSQLQVLWMPCCCLEDLDGISSLSSLRELYLAYNRVSDLSPVGMLENLHILDLEGNDVDDLVQIQFLGLCANLQSLTLDGNPVCKNPNPLEPQTADYSYRVAVRELVPQLRYLDNVSVEEGDQSCSRTMGEDWDALQNSIKEYCSTTLPLDANYDQAAGQTSPSRPSSARRPSTSLTCGLPHSSPSPRPSTAAGLFSPPCSRPGSSDSSVSAVETESSNLTHGAGKILFYGNPAQAIRARREKLRTAPTTSPLTPRELPVHVPEHTYDVEEPEERGRCDVFAELRAWRKEHSRQLEAIKTEKLPQILAIRHSEEEDSEEADSCYGVKDASTDEEEEELFEDQDSPDSLVQSPSPVDIEEPSNEAQLSSPDTALLPSPPLRAESRTDHRKAPGIRTRRLRCMMASTQLLPDINRIKRSLSAANTTEKRQKDIQQLTDTNVTLSPLSPCTPRPPPVKTMVNGLKLSSAGTVSACATSGISRLSPRVPERPSITRPHTARAALQMHYQHRVLQTSRGSSQPD